MKCFPAAMAVVMAATAGSPAKAVRLRASQGRDEVATDVPTPDCNSCPFERSRSEIKLEEDEVQRGHPYMMFAKFWDFLTPSPCPHLGLIYSTKFTQPPLLHLLLG